MDFMATLWIILAGVLAASACALLGSFLVLKRMSLLGDAISHAVLPGIALAFLLTSSRNMVPMLAGATAFGLLTVVLSETLHQKWRVQEDAAIGIIYTALFSLGVLLVTLYAGQIDLDQDCVLYGEIAYTPLDILIVHGHNLGPRPVWLLGLVFLFDLVYVLLFYKELKITAFDAGLAASLGFNVSLIRYSLMGVVAFTTVAAFESVGAILVVAMLIVPAAAAYLWTDRLAHMLTLSVLLGAASSVLGYGLAATLDGSIAGAMAVAGGAIFLFSVIFSPHYGLFGRMLNRFRLSVQFASDHLLLALYRNLERTGRDGADVDELFSTISTSKGPALIALRSLYASSLIERNGRLVRLTEAGNEKACALLQGHRLWEEFARDELALPDDHVHGAAHRMEHVLDRELRKALQEHQPESRNLP